MQYNVFPVFQVIRKGRVFYNSLNSSRELHVVVTQYVSINFVQMIANILCNQISSAQSTHSFM